VTILKLQLTITTLVGLIAFASPDKSFITPKSMGLSADAPVVMVFASPSANFYTGSNPRRLSGLSHRDNFIVTANLSPLIGTMQKHMPTPTQTSTNPNPLAVSIQAITRGQVTYTMTIT